MSLYTLRSKQTLLNEIYLYILLWFISIETIEKVSINYFLNSSNQNLKELVFLITLCYRVTSDYQNFEESVFLITFYYRVNSGY
jgi:hypothetical protein